MREGRVEEVVIKNVLVMHQPYRYIQNQYLSIYIGLTHNLTVDSLSSPLQLQTLLGLGCICCSVRMRSNPPRLSTSDPPLLKGHQILAWSFNLKSVGGISKCLQGSETSSAEMIANHILSTLCAVVICVCKFVDQNSW